MKSPRIAAALALIVLAVLVAPLSASEPIAVESANATLLPFDASVIAAGRCPTYHCPIYFPDDCSCSWIECPDGSIVCGVWNGLAATSSSAPMSRALPAGALKR
jgi:hypothetical protein